ncbi:MAG: YbgF trimerization domain-containing protein, partial [Candidatus Thiodiazotropha taylori]
MNSRIRLVIIGLAIGLGTSTPMLAAENGPNMEQRLQRIERMLQNQSLADLVLQLQQLQREVQQLRGDVELQKHTMDAMSRRQRDLYLDIDQRLSRFQSGGVVTPPPVSQPAPAPAAAPMPQQGATAPVASMDTMANAAVTPPDPQQEEMVYQEA